MTGDESAADERDSWYAESGLHRFLRIVLQALHGCSARAPVETLRPVAARASERRGLLAASQIRIRS